MNATRVEPTKNSKEDEFEFYLKSGLSSAQIVSLLKQQNKDSKDIDAFMEKYEASKRKIDKLVRKFAIKIEQKYGQLDVPELMNKGLKFASKHNFSQAEKDAFIRFVLKGDTDSQYMPFQEMAYTEMSKFLGFSSFPGQTLAIKATDYAALNEMGTLYQQTKHIHTAVRNNTAMYRGCGPEMLRGQYDEKKDNVNMYIHPLMIALFGPKIDVLEERMLYSNVGRMVLQRTQAYFQSQEARKQFKFNFNFNDMLPAELYADLALAYDIARDPNSMNYFSEDSPMSNLLKRFKVQIEIWKNVLMLRAGKFYSKSSSFTDDDGIMGLQNVLSAYDWTYFDSPDMYQVHDEGTMLRKLLAVFSFRPTFTQLSSFVHTSGMGFANLGAVARSVFTNIPICNIRLPQAPLNSGMKHPAIRLESALTQADWYIENKMVVPKNKSVIHSRNIVFFYVNRRYQSVNFANVDMGFRYLAIPGSFTGMTNLNTTELEFGPNITIGNDKFDLTSVIVLNPLLNGQISAGCSAMLCCQPDPHSGRTRTNYFYYNPVGASIMYNNGGRFVRNDPISYMLEHSNDPKTPGFYETAREYGTIFVYVNPNRV